MSKLSTIPIVLIAFFLNSRIIPLLLSAEQNNNISAIYDWYTDRDHKQYIASNTIEDEIVILKKIYPLGEFSTKLKTCFIQYEFIAIGYGSCATHPDITLLLKKERNK